MHNIENHYAVRLFQIHTHRLFKLVCIAFVIFNIQTAREGNCAFEQIARILTSTLNTEVFARRILAVGFVFVSSRRTIIIVNGYVPIVIAIGIKV